jgi:spore germination protein (amino acid permease)
MIPDDDKISSLQLGVFIFNTVLGVGILSLPSTIDKESENNAWMITIIGGLIILIFTFFMCKVGNRFSPKGFIGTLKMLFGRVLGTALSIPVCIYFLIIIMIEIRTFAETTKIYLLYNTPLEFIIYPLIIFVVFLARSGVEPTSRFYEAVTPVTLIIILTLFLVALPKSDYSNLLPVLPVKTGSIMPGLKAVFFSFAGFEILLVMFPFLRKPKEAFKVSSFAVIILAIIYTIEIIQCLARFGVNETAAQIYPVVTLIRSSEVPGGIIERMEGLLLAVWVIFVYTTVVAFMFGLSVVLGDLLKHKKRKHIVPMLLPIIYIGVLQAQSIVELADINDKILFYLGIYSYFLLPTMMFIMTLLKGKGGAGNEV